MTRFFIPGILAVCALGVSVIAAQQQPVLRGGLDIVRVYVTVTDRDGRLVPALTQKDFEVRGEGKPQPITLFDNTPQPIRLVVMLDVSGSMEGNLPLMRSSAEQLFVRLGPDDLARVDTFGEEVTISPSFTRDAGELRSALPKAIASDAPTPLWRGIDEAMTAFGDKGDTRRVVLVLSDGGDSGPRFRQRYVSQAQVIDRARREEVMIYAIGMRSRGGGQPGLSNPFAQLQADLPDPGLALVAEHVGGGYTEIRAGQDLGAAFARIADELHSQYLLDFEPPKRDGKTHEIEVKVAQRGLKPRARKSYVAPKEDTGRP